MYTWKLNYQRFVVGLIILDLWLLSALVLGARPAASVPQPVIIVATPTAALAVGRDLPARQPPERQARPTPALPTVAPAIETLAPTAEPVIVYVEQPAQVIYVEAPTPPATAAPSWIVLNVEPTPAWDSEEQARAEREDERAALQSVDGAP